LFEFHCIKNTIENGFLKLKNTIKHLSNKQKTGLLIPGIKLGGGQAMFTPGREQMRICPI